MLYIEGLVMSLSFGHRVSLCYIDDAIRENKETIVATATKLLDILREEESAVFETSKGKAFYRGQKGKQVNKRAQSA